MTVNKTQDGPEKLELPTVGARVTESFSDGEIWVEVYARAQLPTRFGEFQIFVCKNNRDDKEHVALVRGAVAGQENVPARVHSECLTGDVFASLRCDCREQLEMTLQALGAAECGLLLYMRQEGRGIGLGNKVRAYTLQEQGLDTYEANRHLGFDDDLRDYRIAALMVKLFRVKSIHLATNNPRKILALKTSGIVVSNRLPVVPKQNPHNTRYLAAKVKKSGHLLPF